MSNVFRYWNATNTVESAVHPSSTRSTAAWKRSESGVWVEAAIGEARTEHFNIAGTEGILLEKAGTSIVADSHSWQTAGSAVNRLTVTDQGADSNIGLENVTNLTATAVSGTHNLVITTTSEIYQNYICYAIAKAAGSSSYFVISLSDSNTYAVWDASTGTLTQSNFLLNSEVFDLGNGYYWFEMEFEALGNNLGLVIALSDTDEPGGYTPSFTGAGEQLDLVHIQLEPVSRYPLPERITGSSPITRTSGSGSRGRDYEDPNALLISSSGTFFTDTWLYTFGGGFNTETDMNVLATAEDLTRLTDVSADDRYYLRGYKTANDGGQGWVVAESSSDETDEGVVFSSASSGIIFRREKEDLGSISLAEFGLFPGITYDGHQFRRPLDYLYRFSKDNDAATTLYMAPGDYDARLYTRHVPNLTVNGNGAKVIALYNNMGSTPYYDHTVAGDANRSPVTIDIPSIGASSITANDNDGNKTAELTKIKTRVDSGKTTYVLIYSGDRQVTGSPPNTRNHEYHQVTAVDVTTGVMTLATTIRYLHTTKHISVRAIAMDVAEVAAGVPNVENEFRTTQRFCTQTFNGLTIEADKSGRSDSRIGGGVSIFNNCTFLEQDTYNNPEYAWLVAAKKIEFNNCRIDGYWEIDKFIDDLEFNDCILNWYTLWGGVMNWAENRCEVSGIPVEFGMPDMVKTDCYLTGNATDPVFGGITSVDHFVSSPSFETNEWVVTGGRSNGAPTLRVVFATGFCTDFEFIDNMDGTGLLRKLPGTDFTGPLGTGEEQSLLIKATIGAIFRNPRLPYRLVALDQPDEFFDGDEDQEITVEIQQLSSGKSATHGIEDYAQRDPDPNDVLYYDRINTIEYSNIEDLSQPGSGPNGGTIIYTPSKPYVARSPVNLPIHVKNEQSTIQWDVAKGSSVVDDIYVDEVVGDVSITVSNAESGSDSTLYLRFIEYDYNAPYEYTGKGTISCSGSSVTGTGTLFSRLKPDDVLLLPDTSTVTVASVSSETALTIDGSASFTGQTFKVREPGAQTTDRAQNQAVRDSIQTYYLLNPYHEEVFDSSVNQTINFTLNRFIRRIQLLDGPQVARGDVSMVFNISRWGA